MIASFGKACLGHSGGRQSSLTAQFEAIDVPKAGVSIDTAENPRFSFAASVRLGGAMTSVSGRSQDRCSFVVQRTRNERSANFQCCAAAALLTGRLQQLVVNKRFRQCAGLARSLNNCPATPATPSP
jgi:hypothetical protein